MGNGSERIAPWAVVTVQNIFLQQTVSIRLKTLSNTLLVVSRHVKRERPQVKLKGGTDQKKSLLEPPNGFPLKYLNE